MLGACMSCCFSDSWSPLRAQVLLLQKGTKSAIDGPLQTPLGLNRAFLSMDSGGAIPYAPAPPWRPFSFGSRRWANSYRLSWSCQVWG